MKISQNGQGERLNREGGEIGAWSPVYVHTDGYQVSLILLFAQSNYSMTSMDA